MPIDVRSPINYACRIPSTYLYVTHLDLAVVAVAGEPVLRLEDLPALGDRVPPEVRAVAVEHLLAGLDLPEME